MVNITGTSGDDFLTGSTSDDRIFGEAGDDIITSDAGRDHLNGGTGNDLLLGGANRDFINGGLGNDNLVGGSGDDVYIVDNINDSVLENFNDGNDSIRSLVNYTLSNDVEELQLRGTAIRATGNALDNLLLGNQENNLLEGLDGNDKLNGDQGNDELIGGAGNDFLNGGAGDNNLVGGLGDDIYIINSVNDLIVENSGEGNDLAKSFVNYTLSNDVEELQLRGTAIRATGNALDNLLLGNQENNLLEGLDGNDKLNGDQGNDELIGGAGNDNLVGGAGGDTFVFAELGVDIITDFNSAEGDKIELDSSFFSNITDISTDFGTVTSNANVDTSSELIVYNTTSGQLFYNQNNTDDGFGTGGLFATLSGAPALTAGDFVLA